MPPIPELDDIRAEIIDRSKIVDWPTLFPWWPRPAHVKILFYADGGIRYDSGPFNGLKQVLATLTANHYPWVVFEPVTANRWNDPSADHQNVDLADALALGDFDELWIYSFDNAANPLTPKELAAAQAFMDAHQGGVLITGDHADLGAAFANLPRAGKMRLANAPGTNPVTSNDSLRSGADALFQFDDQSDSTPQPLDLTWYWAGILRRAPHQVLCSPLGPINIFPDHQHEGEAVAPAPTPSTEWPGGVGAEVIARATIVDTNSSRMGQRFGVLSAYNGHAASVGRVLADSTWHHHFDINLRGLLPQTPGRTGFVAPGTATWLAGARKIEHYFVNAGIWLAPPSKQAAMRAAAWWPILWSDVLVQALEAQVHPRVLGRLAYDALGRFAPQCAVFSWIWGLVPLEISERFLRLVDQGDPPPYFEYVAGVATRQLIEHFRASPRNFPTDAPSLEEIDKVLSGAAEQAMAELSEDMTAQAEHIRSLRG